MALAGPYLASADPALRLSACFICGYANLSLNTGHGTLGWTMACGSARALSDLISGWRPDIEMTDLSINRYRTGRQST